jgi:predicted Zn-dependent protease
MEILETAQETFPRSGELSGKLRDVRSLVTEQTYIEGLTQAAESAKIARNQFRCTKLSDTAACEDALRAKPDDVALLTAKGDALMQANRPADAATAYRHVSQLKPGDDAIKTKLANAEALVATTQPPPPAIAPPAVAANNAPSKAPKPPKKPPALASAKRVAPEPNPAIADLTPPQSKTYSNDAPPGQTN